MGWVVKAPTALPPGKRPGTHRIGGCVGPRAGLDGCKKRIFSVFLENYGSDCGGGGVVYLTTLFNSNII